MSEAEEPREPHEGERVLAYVEQLLRNHGFNDFQAVALAEAGVDWHQAVDLLEEGCDPETAVDILL